MKNFDKEIQAEVERVKDLPPGSRERDYVELSAKDFAEKWDKPLNRSDLRKRRKRR